MATRLITLSGGGPWGFTLAGGRDFGSPLKVAKLTPGGKASRGGVKEDEFILAINGSPTDSLLHFDAQQLIKSSDVSLQLKLSSECPRTPPLQNKVTHPQTHAVSHPLSPASAVKSPPPPQSPSGTTTVSNSGNIKITSTATAQLPKAHTFSAPPSATIAVNSSPQLDPVLVEHIAATVSEEAGLQSGPGSLQQSPSFRKIKVGATPTPSALSHPVSPLTDMMKNTTIEEPHVTKTTTRPPPPPNSPSKFTTNSIKVVSSSSPALPKPAPPPTVTKPAPPTSPVKLTPPTALPPHPISDRQGVCATCNQLIRGPFASALGKVFHPEHFTCHHCSKELTNSTFILEGDAIYCEHCYEQIFAHPCYACKKPIIGSSVSAVDLYWHPDHFRCSQCATDLTKGDGFSFEGGQLYCKDCFVTNSGIKCNGCGQGVSPDDLWIEALDVTWHSQCFVCDACKTPLHGGTFFAKLGRPYCRSCA
ncbi:hypothetical protein EMCRGX_G022686 [Ephydatia muelleri]